MKIFSRDKRDPPFGIKLLLQWYQRSWNFPRNGARKIGSLSPGKRFHSSDNLTAESGTQTMMGQGKVGPHLEICSGKDS